MREKTEAVYESWHKAEEVARRNAKVLAWLAKADELEAMK